MNPTQDSAATSSVRVLLIDDDALVRRTIAGMLTSCGYLVHAYEDGVEAPGLVERDGVDLVLLDVRMPKMSGLEVCQRIRCGAHGRLVPIVLLTALGEPKDVIEGLEAGADEFLTKPIEPAVLEARLRALLRFKSAQQAAGGAGAASSLPDLVAARVNHLAERGALSMREREVLDLLLIGRSLDEIGCVLDITPRTVKFHQANLLEKLGADSRLDLFRLIL